MEWLALLGGWLLFAGPVQQAVLELRAEQVEHDRLSRRQQLVSRPASVPAWLWLLPPVALVLHRRRVTAFQHEYFKSLDIDQRRDLIGFLNLASGWSIVAAGAWFIALSETYSITHEHGWSLVWFAVISIAVTTIAAASAIERVRRAEALLQTQESD
jgi:hypothetical protein